MRKRKRLWTGIVGPLLFVAVFAAGASVSGQESALKVPDHVFDFGTKPNDSAIERVFTLENTGEEPLVITAIRDQ